MTVSQILHEYTRLIDDRAIIVRTAPHPWNIITFGVPVAVPRIGFSCPMGIEEPHSVLSVITRLMLRLAVTL